VTDDANDSRRRQRFAWLVAVALTVAAASHGQPSLTVTRPEGSAHPNEPYAVVCEVSWAGDAAAWAILPAQVEAVAWGAVEVAKAEASVRDGINSVTQLVIITPVRTGSYESPEILIPYRNPEDLTPPETSAPATNPTGLRVDPTLKADPFILHVKPDRTLAWVSGGLGALLLCLVLGGWLARKRRPPVGHPSFEPTSTPSEDSPLYEARRHRLDGRPYEFYLSLTRALSAYPGEAELSSRLKERAQAVGFQGVVPTEAQLTEDYADVERALARRPRQETRPR